MLLHVRSPDQSFEPIDIEYLPNVSIKDAAAVAAEAFGFDPESKWTLQALNPFVVPGMHERLDLNFLDNDTVELFFAGDLEDLVEAIQA